MSRRTITAMVFAYLIPGAGHLYLRRTARAVAFFVIVVVMFAIGLAVDGDLYTIAHTGGSLLKLLAALGSMGSGAMYFVAAAMGARAGQRSLRMLMRSLPLRWT